MEALRLGIAEREGRRNEGIVEVVRKGFRDNGVVKKRRCVAIAMDCI